jgi:hypothetical protein
MEKNSDENIIKRVQDILKNEKMKRKFIAFLYMFEDWEKTAKSSNEVLLGPAKLSKTVSPSPAKSLNEVSPSPAKSSNEVLLGPAKLSKTVSPSPAKSSKKVSPSPAKSSKEVKSPKTVSPSPAKSSKEVKSLGKNMNKLKLGTVKKSLTRMTAVQKKMSTLQLQMKVGNVLDFQRQKWRIVKDIGMTSDALLYHGENVDNPNQKVFIKIQPVHKGTAYQVTDEFHTMTVLKSGKCHKYSQEVISYGNKDDNMYILITPLYGNDLTGFNLEISQHKEIKNLSIQIMQLLESIHKCGIVHRDIKPGNIVFTDNKQKDIKLIDFGLSKHLYSSDGNVRDKRVQFPEGTPAHKSIMMHKEEIDENKYPKTFMDDIQGGCWTILDIIGGMTWKSFSSQQEKTRENIENQILKKKLDFMNANHSSHVYRVLQKLILYTVKKVNDEKQYFNLNKEDFYNTFLKSTYSEINAILNEI